VQPETQFSKTRFLCIFILANLLLSSYFISWQLTPNITSRALPVRSILKNGNLKIDNYHDLTDDKSHVNGHYYSDKAPLSSFIVLPVTAVVTFIHPITEELGFLEVIAFLSRITFIGGLVCGTLPFLIILFFLFQAVSNSRKQGDLSPVVLVLLAFYGSFLFLYTGTYFGHLLAGLFVFLSYLLLKKQTHHFWTGFLLSVGFLAEYPVGLAFPLWMVLLYANEKDIKKCLRFGCGLLPGIAALGLYNYATTGSPFDMLYNHVSNAQFSQMQTNMGFSLPSAKALWGLIFSPFRGLLFYSPILALMLFVWAKARISDLRTKIAKPKDLLCGLAKSYVFSFAFCSLLLFSSYYMWWGGWCYGPRHLIPAAILLLYEGVKLLSERGFSKSMFITLSLLGILFNFLAKTTLVYMIPNQYSAPITQRLIPLFLDQEYNPYNLVTWYYKWDPKVAIYLWPVLFACILLGLARAYKFAEAQTRKEETGPVQADS